MIDPSNPDFWIFELYKFQCLVCGVRAVCLHEVPPKSRNPSWKLMPETRYPVCNKHHDHLHNMNYREAEKILVALRTQKFPDAERKIVEWKIMHLPQM